jgi:hypothetical protein
MTEPTQGALNAARIILGDRQSLETNYGNKRLDGIADLINRETAAPELLEALEGLLRETQTLIGKRNVKKHYTLMLYEQAARAAITKAKGKAL